MSEWTCPECGATVEDKAKRGPHLSACRRTKKTKYIYKEGDKHPYEYIDCRVCGERALVRAKGKGFCSRSCAQKGKNNSAVKANPNGYHARHQNIYRTRGKAADCAFGCLAPRYEWAHNVDESSDDPFTYFSLCSSCHIRYDNAIESMQEGFVSLSRGTQSRISLEVVQEAAHLWDQITLLQTEIDKLAQETSATRSALWQRVRKYRKEINE